MKYTKESLEPVVKQCTSIAQVMRAFGRKANGGNQTFMTKRIKQFGLDTSHFLGQGHNKNKSPQNKKTWQQILHKHDGPQKSKAKVLRRALIESGRQFQCEMKNCTVAKTWNGSKITLQVDHINGDIFDDRKENLRFLCPNCHSQTENWGSKKKAVVA